MKKSLGILVAILSIGSLLLLLFKKIFPKSSIPVLGNLGKVKYKVISNIEAGSGFVHNKEGNLISVQSIVPKVGTTIYGELIKKTFIYNKNLRGITYTISKDNADLEEDCKIFIPEENLKVSI